MKIDLKTVIMILYTFIMYYFMFQLFASVNSTQSYYKTFFNTRNCDITKQMSNGHIIVKNVSEIDVYSKTGESVFTKVFVTPRTVKLVLEKNLYTEKPCNILEIKPLYLKGEE